MAADLFPDLDTERARLAFSRASRDRMIDRLGALDPESAADAITKEYIEVTVADALEDLRGPGAGDFFGRIDEWYIGRRHIEDDQHDPVVVDWRAPIAAPFYRATSVDPLGVAFRRRFTLDDGDLIAYLDEHLDDPNEGEVAGGIPDPVLAEIGAERSGEMREIVSTIQAEQDIVIRSSIDQVLVVQGGPGTGKTAVALHRAAYLMFEHRGRLARDGVLVVGPNQAFLDYIANVLPSLGERTVRQATVDELCIPRVEVAGVDDVDSARWKGSADRLADLEELALAAITPPDDDIRIPIGARTHVIERDLFSAWLATAASGTSPLNQRRERMRSLAQRELLQRTGSEDAWRQAAPLKAAINKAWPTQKPVRLVDKLLPGPSGKRRVWTRADQLLVDEANSMLNGSPFTYGHVIVDEAQDHSAVALRVIGRRSPSGSMTLVGDVAQSTTPAGQERWSTVFEHLSVRERPAGTIADLTIGYRVPEPILVVANRLLVAHRRRRHREPQRPPHRRAAHLAPRGSPSPGLREPRPGRNNRRGGSGDQAAASRQWHRGAGPIARRHRSGACRAWLGCRRSRPRTRPRRSAALRTRTCQGSRVRWCHRGQSARDPERGNGDRDHATRRPPALRGDDPRRAGTPLRHR